MQEPLQYWPQFVYILYTTNRSHAVDIGTPTNPACILGFTNISSSSQENVIPFLSINFTPPRCWTQESLNESHDLKDSARAKASDVKLVTSPRGLSLSNTLLW